MKKLTAFLLCSVLVLAACRRDAVERTETAPGFFAAAPRLLLATDSFGSYYLKIIPDAAARTLTFSGDSTNSNTQFVYSYAADGTLTRIVEHLPGWPDQVASISRQGNQIIFYNSGKPLADTVTITELGGGRRQLDIVSRGWGMTNNVNGLSGINRYRVLLNSGGMPERVTDSNQRVNQNDTYREEARLHYIGNGMDTLRLDWSNSLSNYNGFTTYRATRETRVDTTLLRFTQARMGTDLQWLTGHYGLAPNFQIFSTYITNYHDNDLLFLSGGVPLREQLHDYSYNFNQGNDRQRDYRNAVQYDAQGRITRITQTDALNSGVPRVVEIRY